MVVKTKFGVIFPFILVFNLAACAPPSAIRQYNPDVEIKPKRSAIIEEAPLVVHEEVKPAAEPIRSGPAVAAPPKTVAPAASTESHAVLALLQEADASSASGHLDNSAASLERALRIQPRNALLWQKLAKIRLQQHQPGLAEDLAKKSNLLAKDKALTGKNWSIIADARREKGDEQGASEADAKAKQ